MLYSFIVKTPCHYEYNYMRVFGSIGWMHRCVRSRLERQLLGHVWRVGGWRSFLVLVRVCELCLGIALVSPAAAATGVGSVRIAVITEGTLAAVGLLALGQLWHGGQGRQLCVCVCM